MGGGLLLLFWLLGPVLEAIVSRMRFVSSHAGRRVRLMGLSTALANAGDVAGWMGIGRVGLYSFRSAVRPVPCTVHIAGDVYIHPNTMHACTHACMHAC